MLLLIIIIIGINEYIFGEYGVPGGVLLLYNNNNIITKDSLFHDCDDPEFS